MAITNTLVKRITTSLILNTEVTLYAYVELNESYVSYHGCLQDVCFRVWFDILTLFCSWIYIILFSCVVNFGLPLF